MTAPKSQRIRDPVHDLIEFGPGKAEQTLWNVVQTEPFQRLRRIRQLGFSDFVFPGATHTRFAHSLGVFHTAKKLLEFIRLQLGDEYHPNETFVALAAALVHDVGHGMFSHSFEQVGRELKLKLANHETVSELLIRDSEISEALNKWSRNSANDVADVVKSKTPENLYNSVVSSQFDADRLDYMQRDRLMTGVESSSIDETWLMSNLQIEKVKTGTDDISTGEIETLVFGPKAFYVAESYVLSLFHLYPNVYFHKTTRAAEKVFTKLMLHLIKLIRDGDVKRTGLPNRHPIVRFAQEPDNLKCVLALDDTVLWGALQMLVEAEDEVVADCANRLLYRRLPKCFDIRAWAESKIRLERQSSPDERAKWAAEVQLLCNKVFDQFADETAANEIPSRLVFLDRERRLPYKKESEEIGSRLNQILIKQGDNVVDMAELSPVVANAEAYNVDRIYITPGDSESKRVLENIIGTNLNDQTQAIKQDKKGELNGDT